jgi:hypothetical protein
MHIRVDPQIHVDINNEMRAEMAAARAEERAFRGMHFSFDGEPYALVGDPGTKSHFNGDWDGDSDRNAEIEKARKVAHGHFLWFRHEGKSFIVDDPAIVSQVEAMNKPMDELGDQMRALGKQMRDIGQQQREMGKQMRDVCSHARSLQADGRVERGCRQPAGKAGRHHQPERSWRATRKDRPHPG